MMCVCDNGLSEYWMENGLMDVVSGLSGCGKWRGSGSHISL